MCPFMVYPLTNLCNVSLKLFVSAGVEHIHISPGPPSHLRPISMNIRLPRLPVRRILDASHVTMGSMSMGLMILSIAALFEDRELCRVRYCIPRA